MLRAEKGLIIGGQETDGTVAPDDLGLSWATGRQKPDFVGAAETVLASACLPDLALPAFPAGMCTAPDRLEVWRSFAPCVEASLAEAEGEGCPP